MKINKNLKYQTRQGFPVKIYEVLPDAYGKYAVIGAYFDGSGYLSVNWKIDGRFSTGQDETCLDLVEFSPWADFKIDQKVLVWDKGDEKEKRHFAGVHVNGWPTTWARGRTSWTEDQRDSWAFCEKYEGEEK